MGEITRIERQKNGLPRYNIHVDGAYRFAVHEDVLVRFRLSKGMEVDAAEIESILAEEERNKVYQAALRHLSYRPRTVFELKRHLLDKGYESAYVDAVTEELKEKRYLDDRRFAQAWVEERRRRKGYGSLKLKHELEQKGVSSETVEEVLSQLEDEKERELARMVAEKRYRRLVGQPWPKVERRLGQYLFRQGFNPSLVYELLRTFRSRHEREEG
ncbi:MAG: RecX family transcriptional regulator [Firmicutes bacterium]|uniref:Regulatory protein RecX n=1 Tax=Melghirimyces thermohalophilus TaxID=1236220 RepID=A0A1G6J3S0_9BACL|nr:RecX family transcriptional regulator [Melghirimyces thermohalophilus]MDA8352735.1 RecX family transcriptional regulator [Bacillota bacterium]SDC13360.1 regulatory protein [Melghirimyces thermohalophilus]